MDLENVCEEFYHAAAWGRFEAVKSMLNRSDIKEIINWQNPNADWNTPLYMASAWGHFDTIKLLLEYGADINLANKKGQTPLYIAASWAHIHVVSYLIEKGADINLANGEGQIPLYVAAAWAHTHVVSYLIEKGADINLANEEGQTPLYVAAAWAHTHIVSYLIEKGALLNVQMKNGRTALHVAACSKPHVNYDNDKKYGKYSPLIMHFMFNNAKAYIEKLMKTGEYNDLFLDMENDYKKLISCPAQQGQIPDDIMDKVLHYNHFATVTELVRAGADLEIKDDSSETALDKAHWSEHLPMKCFLSIKSKK